MPSSRTYNSARRRPRRFRRRYGRRRRLSYRKRRRYNRLSRGSTTIMTGAMPVSRGLVRKFKTQYLQDTDLIGNGVAGKYGTPVDVGDMKEPIFGVSGARPFGADQWGALYDKYRVHASKIVMRIVLKTGFDTRDLDGLYVFWFWHESGTPATLIGDVTPESLKNGLSDGDGRRIQFVKLTGTASASAKAIKPLYITAYTPHLEGSVSP